MARLAHLKDYQFNSSKRLRITTGRITACYATFAELIKKIRDGISRQNDLIQKCGDTGAEVKPFFANIHRAVQQTQTIVQHSLGLSVQAQTAMGASIQEINRAIEAVRHFHAFMEELRQELVKVESINHTITDIADRTKTIAINSSIIAYKSGIFGRSFSVVAREVENLSAQTSNETITIQKATSRIHSNAAQLLSQMADSLANAEQSKSVAQDVSAAIDNITTAIKNAAQVSGSTVSVTGQLDQKNVEILNQVTDIDQSSQKMLGSSENYLADLTQQESAVHELETIAQRSVEAAQDSWAALKELKAQPTRLAFHEEPIRRPDPALALYTYEINLVRYLHIRLTRFSDSGSIVPYLAETWLLDDDQKTWRFKIKEGARFFNGDEITTEDIRFSFERVMHPKLQSSHANILAAILEGADEFINGKAPHISGIQIDDRYRITFRLKNPYNFFLSMLEMPFTSVIQKNPAYCDRLFKLEELVSGGPFRYVRYDTEQDCDILAANERFLNGRPYLDELVIYRKIPNAYQAFQEGKLDVIFSIPRDIQDKRLTVFNSKRVNSIVINFSRKNYLTRHKALRQAVAMAIDKARILAEAYRDRGTITHSLLTQTMLDTGGKVFIPHDVKQARQIFDSYRERDNLKQPLRILSVVNPKAAYLSPATKIIADNLRAIGMNLDLVELPIEKTSIEEYQNYDIVYNGWTPENDLYLALEPFINPLGGDNFFRYENPEILKALEDSLVIRDSATRQAHFVKIMEQICDDAFMIPVVHIKGAYLAREGFRNLSLHRFNEDIAWWNVWVDEAASTLAEKTPAIAPLLAKQEDILQAEGQAIALVRKNCLHATDTIEDIIHSVKEQQAIIGKSHWAIQEFTALSEELAAQTIEAMTTVTSAIAEAQKGEQVSAQITASLATIKERMLSIQAIVDVFKQDIRQIIDITRQMSQTVQRINTVAIVAAIVGVEGGQWEKDFTNVAAAIRDLSNSSRDEVDKIGQIIENVQRINNEIVQANHNSIEMLDKCIQHVNLNARSLVELSTVIGEASGLSNTITQGLSQLANKIGLISGTMETVNASSAMIDSHAEAIIFGSQLQSAIMDSLNEDFIDQQTIAGEFLEGE